MKYSNVLVMFSIIIFSFSLSIGTAAETKIDKKDVSMFLLENDKVLVSVEKKSGAISSFIIKKTGCDIIGEKRLIANFRLCLPLEDYLCNYIDGMEQKPVSVSETDNVITVCFSGLSSEMGAYPIDLSYTITLLDDQVRFKAKLTNNSDQPISEFWFPRLGGWTGFGTSRDSRLAYPEYTDCSHSVSLFKEFPGGRGLGAESAEWFTEYPYQVIPWCGHLSMVMPWWDIYDANSNLGIYLGYHDKTFRLSTWHTYLYPAAGSGGADAWLTSDEAAGEPVGLVFSHVRYPFIKSKETFESGEFIIRVHEGDWHQGSKFYREWFVKNFPFDKSKSWMRKQSAWFTSVIYQPEDKIIADYQLYNQWCKEAAEYGINCYELTGWDSGGLERNYPQYVPEEKLGGRKGFRKLIKLIHQRKGRIIPFVNYNVLDSNTKWYKEEGHKYRLMDQFGNAPNWMAWGESTFLARKQSSVRRHVVSSVIPPIEKILTKHFLEVVKDGADGLMIDKMVTGTSLDFNPLNSEKPDTALYEGRIRAIDRLLKECRRINPEFCLAAEAMEDRLIPYIDVYYRNSSGFNISPLRYVFPEWTSCQHISNQQDYDGVNGAILTGSVICVEPESYQSSLAHPRYRDLAQYIQEVERIRKELIDIVFLGTYYDDQYAKISQVSTKISDVEKKLGVGGKTPGMMPGTGNEQTGFGLRQLHFRVHGHNKTDRRAIVIANASGNSMSYLWEFLHADVQKAFLYEPFKSVRTVTKGRPLEITGKGLHILLEVSSSNY